MAKDSEAKSRLAEYVARRDFSTGMSPTSSLYPKERRVAVLALLQKAED